MCASPLAATRSKKNLESCFEKREIVMMMDQTHVIDVLRSSTEAVFSTMLDLEVRSGESFVEPEPAGASSGVIGLVGLAGAWVGTVSISCSAPMALRMA